MRIYIPSNKHGVPIGYCTQRSIVYLLRTFKNNPDAIQFIADMLE